MTSNLVIKQPILSEKSAANFAGGLYVFEVAKSATKPLVRAQLKSLYNVEAISVRILVTKPKTVSFRKIKGARAAVKKAYVQLKASQHIPGFELPKDQKDAKATKEVIETSESKEKA